MKTSVDRECRYYQSQFLKKFSSVKNSCDKSAIRCIAIFVHSFPGNFSTHVINDNKQWLSQKWREMENLSKHKIEIEKNRRLQVSIIVWIGSYSCINCLSGFDFMNSIWYYPKKKQSTKK